MKKLFWKILKSALRIFIVVYLIAMVLLYFIPELFLYWPMNEKPNINNVTDYGYPAKEVNYKSEDGTDLFAWYTEPKVKHKGKIIVFMHGNALNIEYFYPKMLPFHKYGYATFMLEYRGFGGIKGKITDKNLEADAIAAIKEVNKLGYNNSDIILYGFSLGSHMATYSAYKLKKEGKFNALILEVPFNTLPNVAKETFPLYMPFDVLIKDKYDNITLIPYVDTRVLIMATKDDKVVPYYLAQDLYEYAIEPKDMVLYESGGHNTLHLIKNYVGVKEWLERE